MYDIYRSNRAKKQLRLRVGRYRVLFDVQTQIKIVDVQEVTKRDERTY